MSTPSAVPAVTNRELLTWMFSFVRPVKTLAILCCVYLVVAVAMEVLATRQLGEAVNALTGVTINSEARAQGLWYWLAVDPQARSLFTATALFVILVVGTFVLRYVREVANTRLSMDMVYCLRESVYDKLQRVGFRFHDAISTGQLINRSLSDLQNVRAFIQTALLTSLEIVLVVGGYMILILTRSPWIALLSLLPLPFWCWYIMHFSKRIQPISKSVMEAGDKNVQIITESIAGVHVVKAFATEKQEIGKYNENCDTFFERVSKAIGLWAGYGPTIRAIGAASHLTLFLAAALLMIEGKLLVGDFLILGTAMGNILGRLQAIAVISEQYQNAIVSARRLYEVLMAPPTVAENPAAKPLPPGRGGLEFENVSFGYDLTKPVLLELSFRVKPGSVVAIVGPTGAGKSTMVNLISRFYDPTAGRVLMDGVDLRDVALTSIRSQVAFVFQETYLFSDTVESNIAYGRPNVTGGEVEAAARLAQAHDFIEGLPKGYQTTLGERGTSLSGGQKQRLAIARAILTNPRVLILDDATASVDPETEDLIRRGMNLTMLDRTLVIIAHRISTVKRADLVLVLEEGRLTQSGTHAELMARDGHYREIAAVQLYGDDGAADLSEAPSHMDRMGILKPGAEPAPPAPAGMQQTPAQTAATAGVGGRV